MIHPDAHMQETHMYTHNSFGIAPVIVGFFNQTEVCFVLQFLTAWFRTMFLPVIITGTRYSGKLTQLFYC